MRLLPLMLFSCWLSGCSSQATETVPATAVASNPASSVLAAVPQAAQELQHLNGSLLTPVSGSVVELAVLLVDSQGRPRKLLESTILSGTGQALPFTLGFAKAAVPAGQRLQLRARVSVSGRLVQRLPGQLIAPADNSYLGALQLVSAP